MLGTNQLADCHSFLSTAFQAPQRAGSADDRRLGDRKLQLS
jgi:hypothetical protein